MERTPIKIPGKNTRDTRKAAVAARKALNRPVGRPLKLTPITKPPEASGNPTEPSNKPKKRSLKHIKSRRKMSALEKLPTELLVDIFLYCMNIDLPRSSPVIGGKLTSELVYTRAVIEAFGPTWENGYGRYITRSRASYDDHYPLNGFPPEVSSGSFCTGGDAKLQSSILRCRWASLSILQKSQQVWVERYGKEKRFMPLPSVIYCDFDVERRLQSERFKRKLNPAAYFDEDFRAFSDFVQKPFNHLKDVLLNQNTYADVASSVEIPQSLLLGPWTEEMTRHLYWLVKGGAQFDWIASTNGEAAMLGLRTAVLDGNLRVLHLLFWAGLQERFNLESWIWVVQNARKNRINIAMDILSMWSGLIKAHELSLMDNTVGEIKDMAVVKRDKETLAFVKALESILHAEHTRYGRD